MIVYMEIEGIIPEAQSLKEKRTVIQSLIDTTRAHFNVSVAEIAYQNVWQRTQIGIAIVTNESRFGEQVMQKIQTKIDYISQFETTNINMEYM